MNCAAGMDGNSKYKYYNHSLSVDYLEEGLANSFQFGLNMGASIDIYHWVLSYRFNPDLTDYFDAKELKRSGYGNETDIQSKTH